MSAATYFTSLRGKQPPELVLRVGHCQFLTACLFVGFPAAAARCLLILHTTSGNFWSAPPNCLSHSISHTGLAAGPSPAGPHTPDQADAATTNSTNATANNGGSSSAAPAYSGAPPTKPGLSAFASAAHSTAADVFGTDTINSHLPQSVAASAAGPGGSAPTTGSAAAAAASPHRPPLHPHHGSSPQHPQQGSAGAAGQQQQQQQLLGSPYPHPSLSPASSLGFTSQGGLAALAGGGGGGGAGSSSSPGSASPARTTSGGLKLGLTRSLNSKKGSPNRVCCNALLAAYARAAPPRWQQVGSVF